MLPAVTYIVVCTSCDQAAAGVPSAGAELCVALRAGLDPDGPLRVAEVECLAVCDRPLTIAFQSPGRWSYVIGNVDPAHDAMDVLAAANAVAYSAVGVPAMADRPSFFRRGVVCRLPPVPSK